MTAKKKSIHQKLMDVRLAIQGIEMKKSGKNTFSGYSYFELADFLPIAQVEFEKAGLCPVVSYGVDVATLTVYDTEIEGSIAISSPMEGANLKGCHPIQNLGATETYQRRYLYMTILELVEHDALDATHGKDNAHVEASKPSITAHTLITFIKSCKTTDSLNDYYKKNRDVIEKMQKKDIDKILEAFGKRKEEMMKGE
jgi:hypothetical protein